MTSEERIDWLCRLRADLNNGVIFTPWNKEFMEALDGVLEQQPCCNCKDSDEFEPMTPEEMQKCRDIVKKYTPKHSESLNSYKWCSLCGAKMQESEEVI